MTRTFKALCVLVGLFCTLNSLLPTKSKTSVSAKEEEIRGVWSATVFSLDYPSKPTTSAESLKKDADNLISMAKSAGYNTLFFQARPTGDAFYESELFPWSKYLTGVQGTAPAKDFDPLSYLIETAHKNDISLHVWLNPYRITATAGDSENISENSIAKKYPHLVVKHTDGKLYLNPGEPETNKLVVDGIVEILKKYDVDGIHIDDYFYPDSSFPDGETFTKYGSNYADIGDWRRSNTTDLIRQIKSAIDRLSPDTVFSVSPSGIWANKKSHPDGSDTNGIQSYFDYYADTRLWVKENLIDWIIPQIYWNIGNAAADFKVLSNWWSDVVKGTNVALCIGQGVYRIEEEKSPASVWYSQNGIEELNRQAQLIRQLEGCKGYVHYRLGNVKNNSLINSFASSVNTGKAPIFADLHKFPWAEDAILSLHEKGIVNGMGDGTFGCERNVSRADFAVMLVRIYGKDAEINDQFSDVTADKYYYKEVGIAKALNIIQGRDENLFDPTGNISRQDMATMVYRLLEKENKLNFDEKFSLSEYFSDSHLISTYAETPVKAMCDMELLSGYETGEFKPQGMATRAETAVFLDRVANLF